MYRKSFLSLDVETTHLDMRYGKIMEFGAVDTELLWDEKTKAIKVVFGSEYQTLINPEIDVPAAALNLTGIKSAELETAPRWPQVKDQIAAMVRGKTICGHNIGFDLEYLRVAGIISREACLDTLEISQLTLPIADSFSLEFLAESLGVSSGRSHRALDDSKTAAQVLGEVVNRFLHLPLPLQAEIKEVLRRSDLSYAHLFLDLPDVEVTAKEEAAAKVSEQKPPKFVFDIPIKNRELVCLPLSFDKFQEWLVYFADKKDSYLVSVPFSFLLNQVPSSRILSAPRFTICEKRLEFQLGTDRITAPMARALFKVLICRALDKSADISKVRFSGEERANLASLTVKADICREHECEFVKKLQTAEKDTLFLDHATLFHLSQEWEINFAKRKLLIFDPAEMEHHLTETMTERWSLYRIRSELQTVFPLTPGVASIFSEQSAEAAAAANEIDLFFGILHLIYLKKENEFSENKIIDEAEEENERFKKLIHPAEKLLQKIGSLKKHISDRAELLDFRQKLEAAAAVKKLQRFESFISEFFLNRLPGRAYWFKFNSDWVDLNRVPFDVSSSWKKLSQSFSAVTIADRYLPRLSWQYFQNRLGLGDYSIREVELPGEKKEISVVLDSPSSFPVRLQEILANTEGSVLILLPNENQLGTVYERLVASENWAPFVLAYKFSGSTPMIKAKLRKRVAAGEKFILLLTTNSLVRSFTTLPQARALVIQRIPFEPPGFRVAQTAGLRNGFSEYALPRAVYLLHTIISRFVSAGGSEIYIEDPRAGREYDREFVNYLAENPELRLREQV